MVKNMKKGNKFVFVPEEEYERRERKLDIYLSKLLKNKNYKKSDMLRDTSNKYISMCKEAFEIQEKKAIMMREGNKVSINEVVYTTLFTNIEREAIIKINATVPI